MRLSGLGVSPGIGIGKAVVLRRGRGEVGFAVPPSRVPAEVDRLHAARDVSREQLNHIKDRLAGRAGGEHAYLFDAQLLMLDDRMLVERAAEIISAERVNAEAALQQTLGEISAMFDRGDDPYLRERKGDVADIIARLLGNLRASGHPTDLFRHLEGPLVLIAHELTPSTLGQLEWNRIAALVTEEGSWTYHTSILARSIRMPAVAGLRNATVVVTPGSMIAVDGSTGEVVVNPDVETVQRFTQRGLRHAEYEQSLEEFRRLPGVTADGVAIRLEANIESPDDAERVHEQGADGIGLFRSEFLLAGGGEAALNEDAQYIAYRRLVERTAPATVTVRTFDISETQLPSRGPDADGVRSPLGLRGVRMSLAREDIFQAQIRALLRAAVHGPLRIMFPFVSSVEELRTARRAVTAAAQALRARGERVPDVPVGVMIEVPSAALTADLLAEEADFFSIGTNDLIQYTLAVDRTDDRVSRLYDPLHPAILRLLRIVSRAGRRRQIRVAVCGEMAADPILLALLVGLGLREFSMAPSAIPLAKQVLREIRADEVARVASRALRAFSAAEIERQLADVLAPQTSRP